MHAIASPWGITVAVVAGYIAVVGMVVTVMARHAAPEPPAVTRTDLPVWVDTASPVRSLPLTVEEMVRELDDGEPVIEALLGEIRLNHGC